MLNAVLAGFVFLSARPAGSAREALETGQAFAQQTAFPKEPVSETTPSSLSVGAKIDLLRRMGASSEIVRLMVPFEVRAELRHAKEQVYCGPTTEAWERGVTPRNLTEDQVQKLAVLRQQEEETVRQLIGADLLATRINTYSQRSHYAGFSQGSLEALAKIDLDADASRVLSSHAESGTETREAIALIESAREEDLRAVLTAEEFAIFEKHDSRAARDLKAQLTGLEISGEQYEAIFERTKSVASSTQAKERDFAIAGALATEANARTAIRFLAGRDRSFREVGGILSESGISDDEIWAFHQAAVSSDNDPLVLKTMADRLPPELAARFKAAKRKESGKHQHVHWEQ